MNRKPGDYTVPEPYTQPTACLGGCERLRWLEGRVQRQEETQRQTIQSRVEDFAGEPLVIPVVGDRVKILQGRCSGDTFHVVSVEGNIYRSDQRVYLTLHDGEVVWYYPWNLKIIP